MGKYFGTDGFRGEAGITLTADHAYKVGRFLGWYYNALRERNGDTDPARIVIGKDTRRSSYMFEYTLMDEEDEPPCADTSIQEKYDMLNPMHQEMVRESIDCYLLKEQKVAI